MPEIQKVIPLPVFGPGGKVIERPLFCCGPGTSSMDAAWELISSGELPVWGAVLMEAQNSGRGRMGRAWQSPKGHIYGAVRLPLAPPFDGPGASLALAFLLAESLRPIGWETSIKWPNDLIFQGGKVGGILLELKGDSLIAGVGFNLKSPPEGPWRKERDPGAPPPAALPFEGPPEDLWPMLVKNCILLYSNGFGGQGLSGLTGLIEDRLLWRGQNVRVERPASDPPAPDNGFTGRIEGLGPDGQLRLSSRGQEYQLWSGTLLLSDY